MRLFNICIFALGSLFLVNVAVASPPQRLIIQFDSSLSSDQKNLLNQQIKLITETGFTLLPHSTGLRWVIVLNSSLSSAELEKVIESINRLEQVKYVEPDNVMKVLK